MASEGLNGTFNKLVFWLTLAVGYGCLLYAYKVMFFTTPAYY